MDGYKILDLGGVSLDADGTLNKTITGIYNAVDTSNKPFILTGINNVKPFFMGLLTKQQTGADEFGYFGMFGITTNGGFHITIKDTDEVLIEGQ